MRIRILVFADLREKLGWKERILEFSKDTEISLNEVLESIPILKTLVTESSKVRKGYIILINGIDYEALGGLKALIKNNDTISIFPPAGGG
ncbi:MAG: molybdopterin synthase sulfur carrier subunit [Thermoprotei archaeon]|nr:MAG: molybdopterin synthase sulfur carrier subunit [Thermoprotei archaeon]